MKFVVRDMSVKASKLHVARIETGFLKTALAKLSTEHRTIIEATCQIYAHRTLGIHSSQPGNKSNITKMLNLIPMIYHFESYPLLLYLLTIMSSFWQACRPMCSFSTSFRALCKTEVPETAISTKSQDWASSTLKTSTSSQRSLSHLFLRR